MDEALYEVIQKRQQDYAWIGSVEVKGPVREVVLVFRGLGDGGMQSGPAPDQRGFAENGALCIVPYCGPWSWMNDKAAELTDAVLDAVFASLRIAPETPVVSTGGSMGGLAALMFCVKSRHKIAACFANCPVCDLPFHATERPDLPRTMYDAFAHYPCGVAEAVRRTSPVDMAESFPDIPYLIIHGEADSCVNKQAHSDKFVAKMHALGRRVEYLGVPGMDHCDITHYPEAYRRYLDFVLSFAR